MNKSTVRLLAIIYPICILSVLASCRNYDFSRIPGEKIIYSSNTSETRYILEGHPSFKESGEYIFVIFGNRDEYAREHIFWPEDKLPYRSVDRLHSLLFEVFEETARDLSGHRSTFVHLVRISGNGRLLYDASVCEFHNRQMCRQIEKLESAALCTVQFLKTRTQKFPHDGRTYLASESAWIHLIWVCPECYRKSMNQRPTDSV